MRDHRRRRSDGEDRHHRPGRPGAESAHPPPGIGAPVQRRQEASRSQEGQGVTEGEPLVIVEADPVADQAAPAWCRSVPRTLETGDVVLVGDHRLIVEGLADLASGFCRVLLSDGSRPRARAGRAVGGVPWSSLRSGSCCAVALLLALVALSSRRKERP